MKSIYSLRKEYLRKFATRLRELRSRKRVSQETLSIQAGFAENYVTYIEGGKLDVRVTTIVRLAKALNVSPRDLLDF